MSLKTFDILQEIRALEEMLNEIDPISGEFVNNEDIMFGLEQEDDDGNYASGKSTTQQKQPIKNYSISEIEALAKTKNILIENICKGYKIESLEVANQQLLNTIYGALLKK